MTKPANPFRYFDSSPEVIRLVVMMYVKYPLSLRNVEDLLFERGIDICHETVRLWWNRFGPMFAAEIRKKRVDRMRSHTHWRWHLDEVYVKINGEMRYLWRAVDHEGEVLESFVTKTRDKAAALAFIKRALKRHGQPQAVVTDGLRSYGAAMKEIGNADRQEVGRWLNNRAENSHQPFRRRERAMERFRRMKTLQKFAAVHGAVHNHFNQERHLISRDLYGLDPKTMAPTGAAAARAMSSKRQLQNGSAAITGVWAEENTRESIFAALKRKETFATSGTRVRVRMFGGWGFATGMVQKANWVAQAYAQGVPMGSDLPAHKGAGAPRLMVQALKDPDGANLDRIQVIKIWLDGGSYKERVFDVALSGGRKDDAKGHAAAVGNTVELKTGTYANSIGAPMLSAVWQDPTFDPRRPAVYYARVLEIPTPRWSTLLAIKNKLPLRASVPATIQERAWTSPIWFTPPKPAARS